MKKARVLNYPSSAQRRLCSDGVDAQADLSSGRSHFVGFIMRRLNCILWTFYKYIYIFTFDFGPGAVARSDPRPPSMRTVAGSVRTSGKHSFVEISSGKNPTTILSLPLIQEGQLSVTDDRMCTN